MFEQQLRYFVKAFKSFILDILQFKELQVKTDVCKHQEIDLFFKFN